MINQLYDLSLFYSRCRIPYLIKLLDFLCFFGIKMKSKVSPKENQVVALGFFLQSFKGISKSITYIDLLEHIKASEHETNEFNQYTHLFEIIYSFPCPNKKSIKESYIMNQQSIIIKNDFFDLKEFSAQIETLFSTEDPTNGFVNINVLINELSNARKEIISFFSFQFAILSSASSFLNNIRFPKSLIEFKGICFKKCDKFNVIKLALSYYSISIDLPQINASASSAKEFIGDRVSSLNYISISQWSNIIIKPCENMKIYAMDKAVKFKTDISSLSVEWKKQIIELSREVIKSIQTQYGDIPAYVIVKNKEIVIVIQKQLTDIINQMVVNYLNVIKKINYKKVIEKTKGIICNYYQKWLNDENKSNMNSNEEMYQIEHSNDFMLSRIDIHSDDSNVKV